MQKLFYKLFLNLPGAIFISAYFYKITFVVVYTFIKLSIN